MLAIIQIIVTILFTILYGIFSFDFFNIFYILEIIGVYLLSNVIYIILIISIFILIVYMTSKMSKKSLKKHRLLMMFSNYFFNSLLRVKPIVKGLENIPKDNNFVVYANHIEYSDPFYLKQFYNDSPLSFVSKEPLYKYPILKTLLNSIGCIPIGKLADRKSLEAILQTIKVVKEGQPMGIFPEGKRSYSNEMQPFKPGAFKVASKAKADISLVTLFDFHEAQVNKLRLRKTKIYLTILPLIKYEDYKDLDTVEISKLAYKKIDEELNNYKQLKKENQL
ncbi:MAG: 1-acyl-sn-glycerol-3-phosphate acyltransferase [Candidatus Izimaplasma sp.]|nr:1-acyl-sn-glycerol-3-phosphate acyltransferase [Candidatus Izimaplasma bacterium]